MSILLLVLTIFEKTQLFQEKRKPSKAIIICAICMLCAVALYAAICFAGFFMENIPITAYEIMNISFGIVILVTDLVIECIFYKRAKANKTIEEKEKE